MKKIFLSIALVLLIFSCSQKDGKTKEEVAKEQNEAVINKAIATLIGNELGELNINIATAKDTSLSKYERETAVGWICANAPEYLGSNFLLDLETLETKEFNDRYEMQKKFIIQKCKTIVAQELYKRNLGEKVQQENK